MFEVFGHRSSRTPSKSIGNMCVCVSFFRNVPRGSLAPSPRSTKKGRKSSNFIGNMCKNGFGAPCLLRAVFGLPAAPKRDNRPALSRQGLHRPIRRPNDAYTVPQMTPRQPRNNPKGHNHPTNQPFEDQGLQFDNGVAGDYAAGVFNPATPQVPC